jgi:hypothetical protein
LYQQTAILVETGASSALRLLPKVSAETQEAAVEIQTKAEYDFSEIAAEFPIGCLVRTLNDGLVGEVVDYSLQGAKGKRKP